MTSEYGTAILRIDDDGTRTVDHADDVIGVNSELLDRYSDDVDYTDGVLTLDPATGDYRYRLTGPAPHDDRVLVFERIKDRS